MHEVALSMQLAKVVAQAAKGRRVQQIRMRVGALRQVVPETLTYAWNFVSKDAGLNGSQLAIEWVPAMIECPNGHRTQLAGELNFSCPICGEQGTVVAGEEFTVIDIDVE